MGVIEVKNVHPHKKRAYWFYIRRVPAKFRAFDNRALVSLNTGIRVVDDPRGIAARAKVAELNAATEQRWKDQAAVARHAKAVAEANRLGFPYRLQADLLANATPEEIGLRMLAAMESDNPLETLTATMGGEEVPGPAAPTLELLAKIPRRRT